MAGPAEQPEPQWVQDARALIRRCESDLKTYRLRREMLDEELESTLDIKRDAEMELLAAGYEL